MSDEYINVRIKLQDAQKFARDVRGAADGTGHLGDEVKKTGRETETTSRKLTILDRVMGRGRGSGNILTRQMGRLATGVAAAGAAWASWKGMQDAVHQTQDLGLATLKLHKNLDLAIGPASELAGVMAARNIDPKQGMQAFAVLSKQVTAAGDGAAKSQKLFERLGIPLDRLKKMNFQQVLGAVADGAKRLGPGMKRTATLTQVLGRGWQTLGPVLLGGRKELDAQLATARKYGVTLNGHTVKSVKELTEAQREQKFAMLGLKLTIGQALIPILTRLIQRANRFVLDVRRNWPQIKRQVQPVVDTVRRLATGVASLTRQHPEILRVAAGMIAVGTAIRGMKAVGTLTQIPTIVGAVAKAVMFLRGQAIGTRLGLLALAVQEKAMAVASKVWAAAQWILNTALTANPIGLVIVAVGALVVAFVLAYKKVGWFRHLVQGAFGAIRSAAAAVIGWLKTHWPLLLAILTGPAGLATLLVVRHFRQIVDFVKGMPGRMAAAGRGMWNWIKSGFRSAINWVLGKWNSIHLTLPKVDLGPLGHVGGGTIGLPPVPLLAAGGVVRGLGSWITGEAGPELNTTLPGGGVRVQPLSGPRLTAPRMAAPRLAPASAGGRPIVVQSHITLKVRDREIARVVNDQVADARARA